MIPVLLYHSVNREPPAGQERWTVSPSAFASHVDALARSGRTAVTVSDYANALSGAGTLPPRPVLVTFDDGFADVEDAAQVLHAKGVPSTLYMTSGWVGRPGMVTAKQLTELGALGVEIGAHSRTHPRLDELLASEVWSEVAGAGRDLEDILGRPCTSFAYPHGNHDRAVRQAVIDAGYRSACGVKNALSHLFDDRYAIARLTVEATTPLSRIQAWLAGTGAFQASDRERIRTRAYRLARRVRLGFPDVSWPGR
jgi:peptidoglycan/xylan/chitin deacetylase (PgdA/CDA1 family)